MSIHVLRNVYKLLIVGLVVASMASMPAGEAYAKKKSQKSEQAEEVAKTAFVEGMELFSAGKYEEALEKFEFSYRTYPNPNVLFNIAMCQKALYRFADSIETFRRFLSEGGNEIPEKHKESVQKALKDLDELVANVRLVEVPPDAEVEVNGESRGTTSEGEPLVLDPGEYEVIIRKPGYEPLHLKVDASAGAELVIPAPMKEADTGDSGEHGTGASTTRDGGPRPLLITGVASGATGVAMGIVGTVLLATGAQYKDDMELAYSTADNQDEYDALYDAANDKYQRNRTGAIVSYSIAGALVATGVVLIVLDRKKAKKQEKAVAFQPTVGGIQMTF